jgi:hypothetical protein
MVSVSPRRAALGMSDLGVSAAQFPQLLTADLAGEGALVGPEQVLAADRNGRAGEDVGRLGDVEEGRQHHQRDVVVAHGRVCGRDVCNGPAPLDGLFMPEVHLQADTDKELRHLAGPGLFVRGQHPHLVRRR